jgi:hypothetical protein
MAIVEVIAGLLAVAHLEPAVVQTFQATRPAAAAAVIQSRQASDGPPADYVEGIAPEHDGWIYQTVGPFDPINRGRVYIYRSGDLPNSTDFIEQPSYTETPEYEATVTICPDRPLRVHSIGMGPATANFNVVQGGRCLTVTGDDIQLSSHDEDIWQVVRVRYRIVAIHPVVP